MAILSREEAQAILKKVTGFSKADECSCNLYGSEKGNVRYARNEVTTSGGISESTLVINSAFGKKLGTTTINEFDDASLEKAVRRSEELARLAPENPEYMPNLGPQQFEKGIAFSPNSQNISPKQRADAVNESLKVAEDNKLVAAGFLENENNFSSLMNSKGLFAYEGFTKTNFSVTMRTQDGTGSGYASVGQHDFSKLNTARASNIAAKKATGSLNPRAIEPGKYTVILEPAALSVLLEQMLWDFDARLADEGRSFMSNPGGGNKLGQKIVDERVNIYSDPFNAELPGSVWTSEGEPVKRTSWIEKGAIKNLSYSRYWAQKQGRQSLPGPLSTSLIMEGTNTSLEEMISSTEKGILVTKLWYIRLVDPQTILLTGLTRDGTFYIENGQIKFPVKNMRFNESPIIMLNNLDVIGKPERVISSESTQNYLLPPVRVKEFTFTSLSDAV